MIRNHVDTEPLRNQRSLTEELASRIANQILSGELTTNERLPTVQDLALRYAVSRTVVRETITMLKADGLIVVRHGAGMFVAGDLRRRPLRIDPDQVVGISNVVEIMQVRLGLEVEAAGLAATHRTAGELRRIGSALKAMINAGKKGELAIEEDRAFHREIAKASHNQYFQTFLEFLGRYIIPRSSIRIGRDTSEDRRLYLDRLEEEHTRIYRMIESKDAEAARRAMRQHLRNGLERLEQLKPEEAAQAKSAGRQFHAAKS